MYRNQSAKKVGRFSEMVQNAAAKISGVTPIEAINEANMEAEVTLDLSTSFGTNRSIQSLQMEKLWQTEERSMKIGGSKIKKK